MDLDYADIDSDTYEQDDISEYCECQDDANHLYDLFSLFKEYTEKNYATFFDHVTFSKFQRSFQT